MPQPRKSQKPRTAPLPPAGAEEVARLLATDHATPHDILGAHDAIVEGKSGVVIRAFHPEATSIDCILPDGEVQPMEPIAGGLFGTFVAKAAVPLAYRLRFCFADDNTWERDDPYRFLPTLGELDLHLFNEGTHRRLWTVLGAHARQMEGVDGVAFTVWAPSARRVSVVGDFCRWDGRLFPMRSMGSSGIFELFVPGLSAGALYKFEIKTQTGELRLKCDPMGFAMENPPSTASRVFSSSYVWGDGTWMSERPGNEPLTEPMAVYEAHLGSWARVPEEYNRPLSYREIAPRLVEHVARLGFTHIELMPIAEHPFSGSWGYQVSGYFAPTSRYGSPDDFRYFVDLCHQHGIGVILDWVPAHFPKDDFALARFDGTALYEHADPKRGEHPDWGTLIFNYGRTEVRNFLIANALYWLEEFHIDGLRVDAVASMLYLDYSRKEGEWMPNVHGGRENLEAIAFLKAFNEAVHGAHPGCFTLAEESTSWTGVSRPTFAGGLGFTFKWNMGWMHDTLLFFSKEPIHRRFHLDVLTFAMLYEYTENFVMPLSHDEVVHGKGSLLDKMPGDPWQKLANLRLLYAYQYTRPGKKLLFMGSELAQGREWTAETSLDWHLRDDPARQGLDRFLVRLGEIYQAEPALWRADHLPEGFSWIDCTDRDNTVVAFTRRAGPDQLVVVLNLTPVPRDGYRVGTPIPGRYEVLLSSDDTQFGGSGYKTFATAESEPTPAHGHPQSLCLNLPPLGALVLKPEGV
ncbi:MAG: 1,4-alpha-glucan branching protein GlgB [Myxococcota bacterium]